jgi:hypothetical protein
MWVITLNSDAEWIEEGRPEPYDLKPGLLKDGKMSADGHKYRVVPMNQAKTPTQIGPKQAAYDKAMVALVKQELKNRNIPYKKLELDPKTGAPKIGKLHSLDIQSNIPGKGNTPQLHGLSIYQTKQKGGGVKRSITTFRTVTDKPDQKDKWIHPSVPPLGLFAEARKWAEEQWMTSILPALMSKYNGK